MKRFAIILLTYLVSATAFASRVDTLELKTRLLPTPEKVTVIVPDDNSHRHPTVYILNGYDGNHTSWISRVPRLTELADEYGMVFVLPDGRDSWYFDSPANPKVKMETFFVDELVPYIDATYPTLPSRDKRAITGLSMGGHGAMWLGMRHPDVFGSAGSMSGGVDIRPFPKSWKLPEILGSKDENPEVWENSAVRSLVPTLEPGQLNIVFDCGVDDFFAGVNNDLHNALVEAKIPHDYTSRPGNHSWDYWRNSILYHLLYFNEAFNKPTSK